MRIRGNGCARSIENALQITFAAICYDGEIREYGKILTRCSSTNLSTRIWARQDYHCYREHRASASKARLKRLSMVSCSHVAYFSSPSPSSVSSTRYSFVSVSVTSYYILTFCNNLHMYLWLVTSQALVFMHKCNFYQGIIDDVASSMTLTGQEARI